MNKAANQATKAKAATLRAEAAKVERRRRIGVVAATTAGLLVVIGAVGWGLSHASTGAAATPVATAHPNDSPQT